MENQPAPEPVVASEAPVEGESGLRAEKTVVMRYGRMGHVGLFSHELDRPLMPGQMLVVRTERGTELGKVRINLTPPPSPWGIDRESLESYLRACGEEYPFTRGGKVLRRASAQDLNDQQHLDSSTREERVFCREQIAGLNLPMRLVSVEHLLGGERIIFYFTSEQRVDFRELVRRMAGRYHTRIEMRQVGARDEARLIADYERCGRHCCCREYLKFLKPVSMKMAKVQKATLDPSKISGRCGRLMCCLRYEDQTYEQLQTKLPRKNTWVRTQDGVVGKVIDVRILTQLVRLAQADMTVLVVGVDEIVERGVAPPPMPTGPAGAAPRPRIQRQAPSWARKEARKPAEEAPQEEAPEPEPLQPGEAAAEETAEEVVEDMPGAESGMGETVGPPAAPRPAPSGPPPAPRREARQGGQPQPGQPQGGSSKRRRRRRGKKRNPNALSIPPQVRGPRGQGGQKPPPRQPPPGGDQPPPAQS